jgi:nucleotide-binding universal stress UspA family protein
MTRFATILHPTDFSECSGRAFEMACELARDYHAKLLVQHVRQPAVAIHGEAIVFPVERPGEAEAAHNRLHAVQPNEPGIAVEHHLMTGDPVSEIVDLASKKKCDLIVMGTHGRSGLSRLILGSVAELVLRKAPCPVLMVKPPSPPSVTEPTAAATTVDVSAAILS